MCTKVCMYSSTNHPVDALVSFRAQYYIFVYNNNNGMTSKVLSTSSSTFDQIDFQSINDQIKHSLALITSLPYIVKFSEPNVINVGQSLANASIPDVPQLKFREPLEMLKNEEMEEFELLVEKFELLWIDDVDIRLYFDKLSSDSISLNSLSQDVNEESVKASIKVVSNDSQVVEVNVVDKPTDMDKNTQITHLDSNTNEIQPPPALQKQHDKQPLPLLIKDVHKITWPNQDEVFYVSVMEMFGHSFETVMVYGIITSLNIEENGLLQRFVIDDGSESISVVWKANKQITDLIKTVHAVDEELKLCRCSGLSVMGENWQPNSKDCVDMLTSLSQIMFYIKREVKKRTRLKLFNYAAVVGKPIRTRIGIMLHANNVQDDSGIDRSLDLYFKQNLIRLYEEKYVKNA